MAQPITCDICAAEPAVLLQTDTTSGEVMAVGGSCLFPFYLGAAAGLADGMPAEVRAEYARNVTALAEAFTGPMGVAGNATAAAKPRRARKGATSPAGFPAAGGEVPGPAGGHPDDSAAGGAS